MVYYRTCWSDVHSFVASDSVLPNPLTRLSILSARWSNMTTRLTSPYFSVLNNGGNYKKTWGSAMPNTCFCFCTKLLFHIRGCRVCSLVGSETLLDKISMYAHIWSWLSICRYPAFVLHAFNTELSLAADSVTDRRTATGRYCVSLLLLPPPACLNQW